MKNNKEKKWSSSYEKSSSKNDYLYNFDLSTFKPKEQKSNSTFFKKKNFWQCIVCVVRPTAEIWRRSEGNQDLGNFSNNTHTYVLRRR